LYRKPAVFSSIVIGCVVPDWPLYVPVGPGYYLTHSFTGLFVVCLPLGLALAVFYQLTLKRPLYELLPKCFQIRLVRQVEQPQRLSLPVLLNICIAILLGAASHIVWDAFTHGDMWGVQMFPSLQETLLTIGPLRFSTYMALQHGSTFVGFPIFLILLMYWCKISGTGVAPASTLTRPAKFFWRAVLLAILIVMSLQIIWNLVNALSLREVFGALYFGVTQAGLLYLLALAALGLHFLWLNHRSAD
jgi:hypothetical protein